MKNEKKIDGRSVRQKTIYDEAQTKLVKSAIAILNDPKVDNKSVNVSLIAKKAGTSVATAYNHFPNNMVDVYGAIFDSAIARVEIGLTKYFEIEKSPKLKIEKFVELQAKEIINLGDSARFAFFNINEILSSGNWLENEPFDVLLNLCNEYQIKNKEIDPKKMALKMIKGFNGCLFMWMRFNKDSDFWSTFNDQWFLNESSKIFSEAVSLQNKSQ